jgi:hypothetical protein
LRGETQAYGSKRHAQRICSDCFARGVLRTPYETVKLNDNLRNKEPTAAEVTVLAPFGTFSGEAYLALVECRSTLKPEVLEKGMLFAHGQKSQGREAIILKKVGLLYGYRGQDEDLHYLSPYEFARYWTVQERTSAYNCNISSENVKRF